MGQYGWSGVLLLSLVAVFYTEAAVLSTPASNDTEEVKNCEPPKSFDNGQYIESVGSPYKIEYTCHLGFILVGPTVQICGEDGGWNPPGLPVCVDALSMSERKANENGGIIQKFDSVKCDRPYLRQGHLEYMAGSEFLVGDMITVKCSDNHALRVSDTIIQELQLVCGQDGSWITIDGFKVKPDCSITLCGPPPEVPYSHIDLSELSPTLMDGEVAFYTCIEGYMLVDPSTNNLTCRNGEWTGSLPACLVIQKCGLPRDVPNGHYSNPETAPKSRNEFSIGSHVKYYCYPGYKLIGDATLFCEQNSKWSHNPPQCIPKDESAHYCPTVTTVSNGRCYCESKSNLQFCEPFYQGLHIECVCDHGFSMLGQSIVTCSANGHWDYEMPSCIREPEIDGDQGMNSSGSTYHMSTLAVVLATACSVLGVLVLVMVIMVFRRRKPHPPRLCRTSAVPPPYSRVRSAPLDEHDRMLLIGYDNAQAALPSYEEATRRENNRNNRGQGHHHSVGNDDLGQVGEYRPLPSIPNTFRSTQLPHGEGTSRHSILTTSTMNRDGISDREVFGSIDTVNVSMSDASTAVTVETMDSTGSHHSNMSRRANAGSINSSNGSLVTEDVPLLDSARRDSEIDSVSNQEDVSDKPES
ncbi:sushi, von Willebrand factor type A, EGF and pentraxin domain-containing protein 1-like isoform X2 [Mya arenaria]|uniref:sushi, von Willebrand factor type A, EGF and pentraxin domain-containing protein 1-like isoform X2 n=1 Tax=Mya arenaria TaxID=6604 RepID=UPI0022E4E543|nr:sushi, von Willebrand factor type A, EGF and pentraxin domain-containing protein 1-like isoform X2 [Mya arenaria]